MELQYAIQHLPCIVVAVGAGYQWRKGSIGYYSAFYEYNDFVLNPFPSTASGVAKFEKLMGTINRMVSNTEYRDCWLQASKFN